MLKVSGQDTAIVLNLFEKQQKRLQFSLIPSEQHKDQYLISFAIVITNIPVECLY